MVVARVRVRRRGRRYCGRAGGERRAGRYPKIVRIRRRVGARRDPGRGGRLRLVEREVVEGVEADADDAHLDIDGRREGVVGLGRELEDCYTLIRRRAAYQKGCPQRGHRGRRRWQVSTG